MITIHSSSQMNNNNIFKKPCILPSVRTIHPWCPQPVFFLLQSAKREGVKQVSDSWQLPTSPHLLHVLQGKIWISLEQDSVWAQQFSNIH